jgi:hypothetical protein
MQEVEDLEVLMKLNVECNSPFVVKTCKDDIERQLNDNMFKN